IYTFLRLLPDRQRLTTRLNRILLAAGEATTLGWFRRGVVAVCALPRNLELTFDPEHFYLDMDFFLRLGVAYERHFPPEPDPGGLSGWQRRLHERDRLEAPFCCRFTPASARCYQLLRVLTHELGHHCDRISNPKGWCSRGEAFAVRYERNLDAELWPRYL